MLLMDYACDHTQVRPELRSPNSLEEPLSRSSVILRQFMTMESSGFIFGSEVRLDGLPNEKMMSVISNMELEVVKHPDYRILCNRHSKSNQTK